MNCPHGMPDDGAGDPPCAACVRDELDRLAWKLRDVTASIARCDHRRKAAMGPAAVLQWCRDCGAFRVRTSNVWELPEGVRYAIDVDKLATLWGQPHDRGRKHSDAKNVIPMKPRT